MALEIGSIVVDDEGNATGSGAALYLYSATITVPTMAAWLATLALGPRVTVLRGVASLAMVQASIFDYAGGEGRGREDGGVG
jgi:hypothetical protein